MATAKKRRGTSTRRAKANVNRVAPPIPTSPSRSVQSWRYILTITATLFLVVGMVQIFFDGRPTTGLKFIATATLYFYTLLIGKHEIIMERNAPSLIAGYLLTAIGASLSFGVWALGIVIYVSGLFFKKEKK